MIGMGVCPDGQVSMSDEGRHGEGTQQHRVPEHLPGDANQRKCDQRRRELRKGIEGHDATRVALSDTEPCRREPAQGHRDGDGN